MQPKQFSYRLFFDGAEHELEFTPQGWRDYATAWARSQTYIGYGRVFTVSLTFVKDGFEMLRDLYEKYGIEAACQLRIYRTDYATYTQWLDFTGDVDFANCNIYEGVEGWNLETKITDAGITAAIAAYEKNVFEIPFDKTIKIKEAANAVQFATWGVRGEFDGGFTGPSAPDPDTARFGMTVREETPTDISSKRTAVFTGNEFSLQNSGTLDFSFLEYETLNGINYPLEYNVSIAGEVYIGIEDGTVLPFKPNAFSIVLDWNGELAIPLYTFSGAAIPRGTRIPFSWSGTVNAGGTGPENMKQEFQIRITYNIPRTSTYVAREPMGCTVNAKIYMEGVTEPLTEPFEIKAIHIKDVIAALFENMYPGTSVISNLLSIAAARDMYLTSGEGIRGLDGALLKTSYANAFKSLMSEFGASQFVLGDKLVRLEDFDFAFNDETILDLGEVRDLTVSPARDWMFNTFKTGSKDVEYKTANGRFEFNSTAEFALPLTRVTNTYDNVSIYRTDSQGVTDTKLQYERQATTSSSVDNDIFWIHAVKDENGVLTPFTDVEIIGDVNQTKRTGVFNHYLSPKRSLLRRRRMIASVLARTNGKVTFTTHAKTDANLISRLRGRYNEPNYITEKSSEILDLSDNTFWPDEYKVLCTVPQNIVTLMRNRIGGKYAFKFKGVQMYGYPLNTSEIPADNKEQELQLLSARKGEKQEIPDTCEFTSDSSAVTLQGLTWSEIGITSKDTEGEIPYVVLSAPAWVDTEIVDGKIRIRAKTLGNEPGSIVLQQQGNCALQLTLSVSQAAELASAAWEGRYLYESDMSKGYRCWAPSSNNSMQVTKIYGAAPSGWVYLNVDKKTCNERAFGRPIADFLYQHPLFARYEGQQGARVRIKWSASYMLRSASAGVDPRFASGIQVVDYQLWELGLQGTDNPPAMQLGLTINKPVVGQPYAIGGDGYIDIPKKNTTFAMQLYAGLIGNFTSADNFTEEVSNVKIELYLE